MDRSARNPGACTAALLALLGAILATSSSTLLAASLNDTGQTTCFYSTGAVVPCIGGQDGRYGRDALAASGALTKIGAGAAGFDFTKIANNGTVLPPGATRGFSTNPTDWGCNLDNVTGLMWEVKSTFSAHLRYQGNTFTWFVSTNNGGNAGSVGTDTCNGSLSAYSNQCNTNNYLLAVNATALCGHSDWRLPNSRELLGLLDLGVTTPEIDTTYFPDVQDAAFWTSSNYPLLNAVNARVVNFTDGSSTFLPKTTATYVRLVRSGP